MPVTKNMAIPAIIKIIPKNFIFISLVSDLSFSVQIAYQLYEILILQEEIIYFRIFPWIAFFLAQNNK
jgi:hypothetical protein